MTQQTRTVALAATALVLLLAGTVGAGTSEKVLLARTGYVVPLEFEPQGERYQVAVCEIGGDQITLIVPAGDPAAEGLSLVALEGKPAAVDGTASRWVRTVQIATGGSMVVPRVGWEIAIEFAEGQSDPAPFTAFAKASEDFEKPAEFTPNPVGKGLKVTRKDDKVVAVNFPLPAGREGSTLLVGFYGEVDTAQE